MPTFNQTPFIYLQINMIRLHYEFKRKKIRNEKKQVILADSLLEFLLLYLGAYVTLSGNSHFVFDFPSYHIVHVFHVQVCICTCFVGGGERERECNKNL